MPRTTPFDIFVPPENTYQDNTKSIITKMYVETSKTVNINLPALEYRTLFDPYVNGTSGEEFNSFSLVDRLRLFFNNKSNYDLFASDISSILSTSYANIQINPRKLKNLCKGDGGIWNSLFLANTSLPHPDIPDRNTFVYEEISLDIKNMVEQSQTELPDDFWDTIIPGDAITIAFSMDMAAYSSTSPSVTIFVKFNVVSSSSDYNFELGTSTSTSV